MQNFGPKMQFFGPKSIFLPKASNYFVTIMTGQQKDNIFVLTPLHGGPRGGRAGWIIHLKINICAQENPQTPDWSIWWYRLGVKGIQSDGNEGEKRGRACLRSNPVETGRVSASGVTPTLRIATHTPRANSTAHTTPHHLKTLGSDTTHCQPHITCATTTCLLAHLAFLVQKMKMSYWETKGFCSL